MDQPPRSRDDQVDPRFAQWRATGDLDIRNALVEDLSWLASFCARRFVHRGESRDDLAQVALVGLVNAVNRFDPERGLSFSTFAVPTIEGELRRWFRDRTWAVHVTRRVKDASRDVASAVDDLTAAFGRTPTVAEIAERTTLDQDEVLEALEAHHLQRGVMLDDRDEEEGRQSSYLGVVDRGYDAARGAHRARRPPLGPPDAPRPPHRAAAVRRGAQPVRDRPRDRGQPGAGLALAPHQSRPDAAGRVLAGRARAGRMSGRIHRFGDRKGRRRCTAQASRRDTCIWLTPMRVAISDWVSSSK